MWNPSFDASRTGRCHQQCPLSGIRSAWRGFAVDKGPRAPHLARQRKGRDSNPRRSFPRSRSPGVCLRPTQPPFQIQQPTEQQPTEQQLYGESEIRTHEASYQLAYSISSRALSTNSAISPNNAPERTRTSDLRFRRDPELSLRAGPSLHPLPPNKFGWGGGCRALRSAHDQPTRAGVLPGRLTRWSLHLPLAKGFEDCIPEVCSHQDPAPPTARLGITRRSRSPLWASPSSPGSPRSVLARLAHPRTGPLFAEGNRRSIQLSYGRS